ncbi:hypothetical protein SEA_ZENTIME222_52 [Mycobacterium phage ZenTime222]|nr:hypothetical protein SEA_ZENTIME222_52 [Mycobacterium phage ZenTime222]QBP28898.1 hypothetical protein SEA_IBRAHIM_53 [Mycobacterium phage Ibrahim]
MAPVRFKVGDRVGAKAAVREQMHRYGDPSWPWYGHVSNVQGQSLIWVRDHLGGEWGLPATELEHID